MGACRHFPVSDAYYCDICRPTGRANGDRKLKSAMFVMAPHEKPKCAFPRCGRPRDDLVHKGYNIGWSDRPDTYLVHHRYVNPRTPR